MYDKICDNQVGPDTLFDICLRLVNKDINNIRPTLLQRLPSYIKRNIMKYSTGYLFRRLGLGFRDEETVKALLDVNIMHLEMTNSMTTNFTLNNISKICPKLQELLLAGPHCSFSQTALQEFLPKMKCITFLSLKGLAQVDDKTVSGLTNLEHLKYLNLKKCTSLTDGSVETLRKMKLSRLDMGYTMITDEWLSQLDDSILNEHLIDLNLSFCKNLTSSNLKKLNWSKLKYVGLFGQNDLGFISEMGKLKHIEWTIPF